MSESIDGIRGGGVSPAPPEVEAAPSPAKHAAGPGQFERLLRALGREIEQDEALVEGAMRGHAERMDAGTLIALQAGIYRYSEAIDLTVKLVDRATSSVKTVLESGR
jgi:hypothetical protein